MPPKASKHHTLLMCKRALTTAAVDAFRAAHELQDIGHVIPKYSRYSYTHLKLPTAGSPNGAKMIIWPKELFDDWR